MEEQERVHLETRVVGGSGSLEDRIEKLETSLKSRRLTGAGLNRASNAERRQLIDLREELALSKHDHLPETTDERTLRNRERKYCNES